MISLFTLIEVQLWMMEEILVQFEYRCAFLVMTSFKTHLIRSSDFSVEPQNRFLLPNTGANYRYKRGRWMCGVEI